MSVKASLGSITLIISAIFLYRGGCTIIDLSPKESRIENISIDPISDPVQKNVTKKNNFFLKEIVSRTKKHKSSKAIYWIFYIFISCVEA